MAHSICSSFEQLADVSLDLFQAEKKVTVVKAEQIHTTTIKYFHSKRSKNVILSQPTAQNLNKWSGPRPFEDFS